MLCVDYKKKCLTDFWTENATARSNDAGVDFNSAPAIDLRRLESVYRQYVGYVYRLCLQLLTEAADAEEATVQVFVRLNRELVQLEDEPRILRRLSRLVVREASIMLRKRAVKTNDAR